MGVKIRRAVIFVLAIGCVVGSMSLYKWFTRKVIALWLGHESSETTHQYVEADLEMKRSVLNRTEAPATPRRRKKVGGLLDFLDRL